MHNEHIAQILEDRFDTTPHESAEIVGWIHGVNQLEQETFEKVFLWYATKGNMPYYVAKGNSEDPTQWVFEKLTAEFRDGNEPVSG